MIKVGNKVRFTQEAIIRFGYLSNFHFSEYSGIFEVLNETETGVLEISNGRILLIMDKDSPDLELVGITQKDFEGILSSIVEEIKIILPEIKALTISLNKEDYQEMQGKLSELFPFNKKEHEVKIANIDGTEITFENKRSAAKKPPVGIIPEYLHKEKRIKEIEEAIERYSESRLDFPKEWLDELKRLKL